MHQIRFFSHPWNPGFVLLPAYVENGCDGPGHRDRPDCLHEAGALNPLNSLCFINAQGCVHERHYVAPFHRPSFDQNVNPGRHGDRVSGSHLLRNPVHQASAAASATESMAGARYSYFD